MASKLKAVTPKAAAPSKGKIVVFGKPGVGKTMASLSWPSVYFIDTEGGANLPHYIAKLEQAGGAYLGPEHGSQSFDCILEQVQALATEQHSYRTLVIDSLTKPFNQEIAREMERLGDKDVFGASKKPAIAYVRRLIAWLSRLDMNVILICHEKSEWGVDADGKRTEIGTTFDAWEKLEYELHLCLQVQRQGDRRIARVRKSRLQNFADGSSFPWSYSEFADRYGREFLEAEAKPIVLASPEQLAEVQRLLGLVRIDDSQIETLFSRAGVSDWPEMSSEWIDAAIRKLRGRLDEAAADPASAEPLRAAAAVIRPIKRSAK
jgi:hypothetical protein